MQMIDVEVSKLKPFSRRKFFYDDIKGRQWEGFLESVRNNGVIVPISITQNYIIINGHQRVRACKKLGIKNVKCIMIKCKNNDEIIKNMIAANIQQGRELNPNFFKGLMCILEINRIRKKTVNN